MRFSAQEWNENDDLQLVISDGDGVVRTVWHDYTLHGEPAFPPTQPDEGGREVLSESQDMPDGWKDAMKRRELMVDRDPSDIRRAVKKSSGG